MSNRARNIRAACDVTATGKELLYVIGEGAEVVASTTIVMVMKSPYMRPSAALGFDCGPDRQTHKRIGQAASEIMTR